jgi:hypothetical protein
VTYVVDGIGEFHSLGDALQAAIVHPDSGGQPPLALQKAKPSAPLATAPATDDTLTTVLLVGVAALVAYLVYDAVKQDDKAEAAEADDDDEDEEEDEEPAKEDE